jgi:hypothetical protein
VGSFFWLGVDLAIGGLVLILIYSSLLLALACLGWNEGDYYSLPKSTILGFVDWERTCALDRNCRVPFFRNGFFYFIFSYDI